LISQRGVRASKTDIIRLSEELVFMPSLSDSSNVWFTFYTCDIYMNLIYLQCNENNYFHQMLLLHLE